ncbi:MAG: hypothetical protein H3C57_04660 [Gammaproteobacteria bacterium]|nr:hypothetical protein [Gammaproteobacteria bacterium]
MHGMENTAFVNGLALAHHLTTAVIHIKGQNDAVRAPFPIMLKDRSVIICNIKKKQERAKNNQLVISAICCGFRSLRSRLSTDLSTGIVDK